MTSAKALMPWLGKGTLALLDQGLFAGSNFLLNVLLARWLAPDDYGAFALAYSVFLLLGVLHSSLLTGPMLVFGPGKYRERFHEYLGILLRGHLALTIPGSALLAVAAFFLGRLYSPAVGQAFLALAVAAPFILLLWLLRRAFYIRLNPGWAAAGGGIYLLLLLAGAAMLHTAGLLTPATGFFTMAVASLMTCLFLLVPLRPMWAPDSSATREVAADHWRFGKWVAAGGGPTWVTESIYYVVLPAWAGLAEAGALRALMNLAQPAMQSISSLVLLLLPMLVRDRDRGDSRAMKKTINLYLALFVSGSACYLALLWGFRFQIFHLLYGDKYSAFISLPVLLLGLLPLVQSVPNVLGNGLGALERPNLGFISDVGGSLVAIAVGLPLVYRFGVVGAFVGLVASNVVRGGLSYLFLNRSMRVDERLNSNASSQRQSDYNPGELVVTGKSLS